MRISIVTPTFNQGSLISQAFESILMQDAGLDIEYIVIDGGSTDATSVVVREFQQRFIERGVRFTYVSEPDAGQSDAINKGIGLATGTIIGVLCSDDYYEPFVLKRVEQAFCDHPKTPWGYGGWRFVDFDREVFSITQPKQYSYSRLQVLCNIGMPSCFYRKDLLESIGLVNRALHLSMDYDMWFRMAGVSEPFIMPFVVSNMRYYGQTKSGTKTFEHLRESYRLQRKYTKGLVVRLRQLWYFFRGLMMILLHRDVTTRVEQWRQRRLRQQSSNSKG